MRREVHCYLQFRGIKVDAEVGSEWGKGTKNKRLKGA